MIPTGNNAMAASPRGRILYGTPFYYKKTQYICQEKQGVFAGEVHRFVNDELHIVKAHKTCLEVCVSSARPLDTSDKIRYDILYYFISRCGGIGRHKGLKIPGRKRCAGSSPASGTISSGHKGFHL